MEGAWFRLYGDSGEQHNIEKIDQSSYVTVVTDGTLHIKLSLREYFENLLFIGNGILKNIKQWAGIM